MVAALLLLAVAVRIPVMLRNPLPAGDGITSHVEMAVNLIRGNGFSTMRKWNIHDDSMAPLRPEGNRQPIMAMLLAPIFMVTGPSFPPAQVLALFLGILCLSACWFWTRRLFGTGPALFTLLVLSVTPMFVWYSVQPDSLLLFTFFFFVALVLADVRRLSPGRAALLGLVSGLAYLSRTQGLLLIFSMGAWILFSAGKKRFSRFAVFSAVFLLVCAPWFIRNLSAFGSPIYTQGSQFLLNENHWSAWEVREEPPGPMDLLRYRGPASVLRFVAAGILRVMEPFTTGSLHRGEVFGQPSLVGFALLALLLVRNSEIRKRLLPAAFAAIPPMAMLALHEHSNRYLAFLVVLVTALGSGGLLRFAGSTSNRTAVAAAALLLAPFVYPMGKVLVYDTRAKAAEAAEVSSWISVNTDPDDWVVTFPTVEMMIWDYRRPTLTMPNDYEALLWPCLQKHGVRYVVIDEWLPRLRPHLARRWRRSATGDDWQVISPPPFLEEVYRSGSERTLVYEMTGEVPRDFMSVDSLPRDNLRALPPTPGR